MANTEITIPQELTQMIQSNTIAINEMLKLEPSYQTKVTLEGYQQDLKKLLEIRNFIINIQS